MKINLGKIRKLVGAVIVAVLGIGVTVLVPGLDPALATSVTGLLTAAAVYFVPNTPA